MGINTAVSTSVIPISAPLISCMDSIDACFAVNCFSCIKRSTFSTTTIASSTRSPIASTKANKVKVLMLMPSTYSTAMVPRITTGTVMAGISVARQFCRKINITTITSKTASNRVFTTSLIDSCTKGVLSRGYTSL